MVQFGFEDDPMSGDMDGQAASQAVEVASDTNVEDGPDDTFEFRTSRARIPGSFNFTSPLRALGTLPQNNGRMSETTPNASSDGSTSSMQSSESASNRSDVYRSVAQESYDYTNEDETLEEPVRGDDRMSISTSTSSNSMAYKDSKDWPEQLRCSGTRFHLLDSGRRSFTNGKSLCTRLLHQYNTHELDADLFGTNLRRLTARGSPSKNVAEHHKNTLSMTPRFLFRWHGSRLIRGTDQNDIVRISNPLQSDRAPSAERCLSAQLGATKVTVVDGIPCANPLGTMTAASMIDEQMDRRDQSLWKLVSTLFDPLKLDLPDALDMDSDTRLKLQGKVRRARYSRWLQDAVSDSARTDDLRATHPSERIFAKLTGNQRAEACSIAISTGDFRLATLIPLTGSDDRVRQDLKQQLDTWRAKENLAFFDNSYRIIYEVLSGSVLESKVAKDFMDDMSVADVHIARNLDWKRAMGLHLWFASSGETPLANALSKYESAMQGNFSVAPPYVPATPGTSSPARQRKFDIDFLLLKLYTCQPSTTEDIFDPRSIRDSPLDYQNSWLLFLFLSIAQPICFSSADEGTRRSLLFDQLTANFASQLESLGRWEWAVFVTLHTRSVLTREVQLRNILARNCSLMTSELESFLVGHLKIPRSWILEAGALHARSAQDHVLEAHLLMSTDLWSEAHQTMILQIAPQAIISGDLVALEVLLRQLKHTESIDAWIHGGQIYADALKLIRHERSVPTDDMSSKSIAASISRLILSLTKMRKASFEQVVAQKEISALVVRLLLQKHGAMDACLLAYSDIAGHRSSALCDMSLEHFKSLLPQAMLTTA